MDVFGSIPVPGSVAGAVNRRLSFLPGAFLLALEGFICGGYSFGLGAHSYFSGGFDNSYALAGGYLFQRAGGFGSFTPGRVLFPHLNRHLCRLAKDSRCRGSLEETTVQPGIFCRLAVLFHL